MNYYIQGNKDKADQIKAAFEKLGVASNANRYNYKNDYVLYFSAGGMMHMIDANGSWANIIKTHPDYKELELPVEPKFKKGDWIACDADSFTLSIKSVKDGNYYFHQGASLPIKDIDEHYHLWSIADAKDGDILSAKIDGDDYILIFKQIKDGWIETYGHYYITIDKFCAPTQMFCRNYQGRLYPATQEQYRTLFKKMHDDGYEWDFDKKELKKIHPHYDISNFKPFDKVLVRDNDRGKWRASIFSYHIKGRQTCYPFCCIGNSFSQCIPYECNEHLFGTTDMCDEMYINW